MMFVGLILLPVLANQAQAQIFRLPEARACEERIIHADRFGKSYHFSWLETGDHTKWDWEGARNYCRRFCMDAVSIETKAESDWINTVIRTNNLDYIWTGGRKCNFEGCDRPDLQPAIINGWYWAPLGKKIPAPRRCNYCFWSNTGGLKERQPDNRHKKPVICQDSDELLDFIFGPEEN